MNYSKICLLLLAACAARQPLHTDDVYALPELVLRVDDTLIDRSCRITIPEGLVIDDDEGDGVIQIVANDIEVEFAAGSVLRGAPADRPWDRLVGIGVRVNGRTGVRLSKMKISGYRVGLAASNADGLKLRNISLIDNFRQHLASTTQAADDGKDWLDAHHNDAGEWAEKYGAGISIAASKQVTVQGCRVRRGQNGILLDRVIDSQIYDNDCSFLSGWGIAMWRSSQNLIASNALDFCIRGYSHGVYNRGQDSAGLLMFEQCNENIIAQNSITHGGDGIFGFAGKEALGEAEAPSVDFDYSRRGNNDNLFIGNDCSYAAAHGLEMTFSFGNRIIGNRFADNAICGVWGGYSSDTDIAGNEFLANGDAGYGAERGGINIEHGSRNRIHDNLFAGNRCGVFLWWDEDQALLETPWAKINGGLSNDNEIIANHFHDEELVLQLRRSRRTIFSENEIEDCRVVFDIDDEGELDRRHGKVPDWEPLKLTHSGELKPIGARSELAGRENIIIGEWGPWDHQEPLLRALIQTGAEHVYEIYGVEGSLSHSIPMGPIEVFQGVVDTSPGKPRRLILNSTQNGAVLYQLDLELGGVRHQLSGTLMRVTWQVAVFPWSIDPREDYLGWRNEARQRAVIGVTDALDLNYGGGGPRDQDLGATISDHGPSRDRFGTIATSQIPLTAGLWRIVTHSDDGVRVTVDGKRLIDNWTWHGPTRDEAMLQIGVDRVVAFEVEHFEIDGHALLRLELEPVADR